MEVVVLGVFGIIKLLIWGLWGSLFVSYEKWGVVRRDTLLYVGHGFIHRCVDMRVPGANDNRVCIILSLRFYDHTKRFTCM